MKLKKRTLKELLGVVVIILISTMPYFHDVITERGVGVKEWVPNLGIEKTFADEKGKVFGFSSYRVFIYTLFIHLLAHIGFLGWMMDAKGKYYRIALSVPVFLSGYTIAVILFNERQGPLNSCLLYTSPSPRDRG